MHCDTPTIYSKNVIYAYEVTRPICFLYSVIYMLGKIYTIASTNNKTCPHLCMRHVRSNYIYVYKYINNVKCYTEVFQLSK